MIILYLYYNQITNFMTCRLLNLILFIPGSGFYSRTPGVCSCLAKPPRRERTEAQLQAVAATLSGLVETHARHPQIPICDRKSHLDINYHWLRNDRTRSYDRFAYQHYPADYVRPMFGHIAPEYVPESPPMSGISDVYKRRCTRPSVRLVHSQHMRSRKRRRSHDDPNTSELSSKRHKVNQQVPLYQ